MSARPLVSFVGAGPGDPELITLKGLRRLHEADVVIHDRLIPLALLAEVRPGAEIIDVGKTPGCHGMPQDAINALLVGRARTRGVVVRLKGGDPTVFGRLAEEIRAVGAAGIGVEIIPGVTAATAAAAHAGISLTERGAASMVIFATGTDHRGGQLAPLDWDLLAETEGTLVLYMAVRGLATIVSTLVGLGRDREEPAVVVESAGTPRARAIAGRLGAIADLARAAGIAPPAVLIVGPTVAAVSGRLGALAELASLAIAGGA